MKRINKYLIIPGCLFSTPDLTIMEKWVLISIDSYSDHNGTTMGVQSIASDTNIPTKEVKTILKSLQEKGAISISVGENGEHILKPFLYKEKYVADKNNIVIGDTPKDAETIDFAYIQEQWNTICNELPKLEKYTPRRKQKTRTAMKGAGIDVPTLIKVFQLVATSAFLSGKKTEWSATFDWIVKSPDIITKILEGNYHKDYIEQRSREQILNGVDINIQSPSDDFYR